MSRTDRRAPHRVASAGTSAGDALDAPDLETRLATLRGTAAGRDVARFV